jgi:HK97 gp10 family phage protein
MPVRGQFEIKGLDGYLETLVRAGVDVDRVVADVLTEAAPIAEDELRSHLLKTKQQGEVWTGVTEGSIEASGVQRDGNYHFIELSVGASNIPQAFYKEYGTGRQAAEPFVRPAFRKLRQSKLKQMMKAVLEAFGLPTT